MIEHVYRRAERATRCDAVVVAADDERIAQAVADFGGIVVMTDRAHATGTDRLAEVSAVLEAEFVVNVQGDEPLIAPAAIDQAIDALAANPAAEMSTLRIRLGDPTDVANPHVVKVVVDTSGVALYFSRQPVPYVRPDGDQPAVFKHVGLYVYRRSFLGTLAALPRTPLERAEGLEQLRALEHGYRICTVETTSDTIGVDTPDDLERVRRLVKAAAR